MTAYAALVSLINVLDQIQNHPRLSTSLDKKQTRSLGEEVDFLLAFIESKSHGDSEEAQVLESQIASAAHAAEDVIEAHVVEQIYSLDSISVLDLKTVIQHMCFLKQKFIIFKQENVQHTYSMSSISSTPLTIFGKNRMVGFHDRMVGFHDRMEEFMDILTSKLGNLTIIPIVGMGGSGKTILARNAYRNSLIVQHFDICLWATISQVYNEKEILLELFHCLSVFHGELDRSTNNRVQENLYKTLKGRRYLIILDDMWSIEVWNNLSIVFPNDNNDSRVVVTTRISSLAMHLNHPRYQISMNFLDEKSSWELFCDKVFPGECCPPELEMIGRKIVKKCKRLPLSIVLIGEHLAKFSTTEEYWESISKDINSVLNSGEHKQRLDMLSYAHLPAHLKPCFLYMGYFLKDNGISVSQLIKLWVAEGFIRSNGTQSLEEIAEGYLRDLVDWNLILVDRRGSNGKMKTCSIHESLRTLCSSVAEKGKFFCEMRVGDFPPGLDNERRRIVFHERFPEEKYDSTRIFHGLESSSLARSLVSKGGRLPINFPLLRVLNVADLDSSLDDIFKQVNLRYVCTTDFWRFQYISCKLPSSISLVWNLQMLTIRGCQGIVAPSEIWSMSQLRHLEFDDMYLPDPPLSDQQDEIVLGNLQTLKRVMNLRLSEEVCKKIPNIKKLGITYHGLRMECEESSYQYWLKNIGLLHKLESLNCCCLELPNVDLLHNVRFPSSLRKLTLEGFGLNLYDLSTIGSLPHLEVVKLKKVAFIGAKWDTREGDFDRLKFLGIYFCTDLIYWDAAFPNLENLVLQGLDGLDEIPIGIADTPTLDSIDLEGCSESAALSAVRMLDEQESLGNDDLQLRIKFCDKTKLERFREKLEQLEFSISDNLELGVCRR